MDSFKDFYPTPIWLIEKLFSGISFYSIKHILEPSAGKGDICDYVKQRLGERFKYVSLDTIEINNDLQHILKGKNFRLIHDDFLTFRTHKIFDLIVANFPFSNGDEHLQHALNLLQQNGGRLRCLVNAETIRNPFSKLRQRLITQLDELKAEIEFLPNQFSRAERPTGAEIALIRVNIVKEIKNSVILDTLTKSGQLSEDEQSAASETAETSLVAKHFVRRLVDNFNLESELGIKLIEEYFALKPRIKSKVPRPGESDTSSDLIKLEVRDAGSSFESNCNTYLEGIRHKYWAIFLEDPRFCTQFTSNIISDLEKKLEELKTYDFTEFNISELFKELTPKINRGIEESILKMFDEFSHQYHYSDYSKNIHLYTGWKTNKAHKINSKIILPMNGFSSWSSKREIDRYYIEERLADMVKVFNYLSDDPSVNPKLLVGEKIEEANKNEIFTGIDLRYFEVVFYKKGTAHIKFKNQRLLDKFNIFGSRRKGWLPPSYGTKSYCQMDQEEKSVIDEFQGRENYEEVFQNRHYYLVEPNQKLLPSAAAF